MKPGERIYWVEDGYVRGFCTLTELINARTGRVPFDIRIQHNAGWFALMDATTWHWIKPIPMRGFQNWQYSTLLEPKVEIVGGWLDPRPEVDK